MDFALPTILRLAFLYLTWFKSADSVILKNFNETP